MTGKISDMSAATTLTGTELVEVVQAGVNVKTTIDNIRGQNSSQLPSKIIWEPLRNFMSFAGHHETIYDLGTIGNVNNPTIELDCTLSNNFFCTLGSNVTFDIINPMSMTTNALISTITSLTIYVKQDIVGNRTITWPNGVLWPDAILPTTSIIPGAIDVYTFLTYDTGTTWIGIQQMKGVRLPV